MDATRHVIVGAGPIGTELALQLAEAGHEVRIVTRSGGGPDHPAIERRRADASDRASLEPVVRGAAVLYDCANPGAYQRWAADWPPIADAMLAVAESSGAVLVTMSNLYGYGTVDGPISRSLPLAATGAKGRLRGRMWLDALAAHRAGRVRATEARAADYLGPTVPIASSLIARYADRTLVGRTASVFGDPDQPHSWCAVADVARTLVALGADERAWGEPWLVPANPPVTIRQLLGTLAASVGAGEPHLRRVPRAVVRASAPFVPILRELVEVLPQFERPFVVDATETSSQLGVVPSPWPQLVETTASAWLARARRATG